MKKNLFRRIANRILGLLARVAPGATTLRPMLHRLRGVKIRGKVFIGDDVYIENEYPEAIELEDGAQICLRSLLLAHTRGAGRIVIGRNAFIGANCVVTATFRQDAAHRGRGGDRGLVRGVVRCPRSRLDGSGQGHRPGEGDSPIDDGD